MLINFRKGYSGIIPFVYEGKEDTPKYMQCEVCTDANADANTNADANDDAG